MGRTIGKALAVLLLALSSAISSTANEGRTPIWQATTISESGSYVVTRDIESDVDPVIQILGVARNVKIDLNGFTLTATAGQDAIQTQGSLSGLTVRNGSVVGGGFGAIDVASAATVILEDLRVVNTGQCGILISGALQVAVRRNIVSGGDCGIAVQMGVLSVAGSIERNLVSQAGLGVFFDAGGASAAVRNNRIEKIAGGFGVGIFLISTEGALIAENTVVETEAEGILLQDVSGSKLFNNAVVEAGGHGILLTGVSDDNLILDNNSSTSVGGSGLVVEGARNYIRGNLLNANHAFGIHFPTSDAGSSNTYGDNAVRGNLGSIAAPCLAVTCGVAPDHCDEVGGNDSFGDNMNPGPPPC